MKKKLKLMFRKFMGPKVDVTEVVLVLGGVIFGLSGHFLLSASALLGAIVFRSLRANQR